MFYDPETNDMDLEFMLKSLELTLNIPENHYLVAVFENDDSNEIIGFACAERGREDDYPVYTFDELLATYGERSEEGKNKILEVLRNETDKTEL